MSLFERNTYHHDLSVAVEELATPGLSEPRAAQLLYDVKLHHMTAYDAANRFLHVMGYPAHPILAAFGIQLYRYAGNVRKAIAQTPVQGLDFIPIIAKIKEIDGCKKVNGDSPELDPAKLPEVEEFILDALVAQHVPSKTPEVTNDPPESTEPSEPVYHWMG